MCDECGSGVPLSDDDVERVSEALAEKIHAKGVETPLSPSEVKNVRDILATKKGIVRATMYVFLALAAYAMKDVYYALVKVVHYITDIVIVG